MSSTYLAVITLTAFVFSSCNEDIEPTQNFVQGEAVQEAVMVEDGTLHFASAADYDEFSLRMANCDPEERLDWEERHGFTSMLSYAERVASDAEIHIGEALGRPDIFAVAADSTVTLEVPDAFASAANADGYYFVGSSICKVDKEFTASVVGGGKEDVDAAIRKGTVPDGQDDAVYRYAGNGNLKAGYVGQKVNVISKRIKNDHYRMDYSIRVYVNDCDMKTGLFTIYVEQKSTNGDKKHRRWRDHHSKNTYRDVSCDVNHPLFQGSIHLGVPNYFGNSRVNHSKTEPFYCNGQKGIDYRTGTPYFTDINGNIICESVPKEQINLWMLFNGYSE